MDTSSSHLTPPSPARLGKGHDDWIASARGEFERCRSQSSGRIAVGGLPAGADYASLVSSLAPLLPGYELGTEVHRGGQGFVVRAVQLGTRRDVAIKVMRGGTLAQPQERARFDREVQILGQLKHPNIVTILDSGSSAGSSFFIMDYIRGKALDAYVRDARRSPREIAGLFVKICEALNAAHLRGIIHRDLKPGNIRIDPAGAPHLLDFGLAKVDAHDPLADAGSGLRTVTGEFLGSLPWASPEQAEGRPDRIDIRTDVYALGVILFQSLTGRPPYGVTGRIPDVLHNICHADPARPGVLNRAVDHELETIVLKCLRKSPEARYQSAGELGRDLRRYLEGEAIEAKRDSNWYVVRKAIRRHRVTAAIAGLAAALVVTVAVGTAVMYRQESRLRATAERAEREATRQAGIAQAVNEFLNNDLLAAVKPEERGPQATVRDVLDAAAKKIDGRFADEPQVEAAIRQTLADAYMELGEWREAVVHAEKALALRRQALGDEAPDTLTAMNLTGRIYRRLGRFGEAERVLAAMIETSRRVMGDEHDLTTRGMNNRAYVLWEMGRQHEALELNARVLDIRTRRLGREHPETLTSMNNAAFYVQTLGQIEEAERQYAEVYEIRQRILGQEHPDTLLTMHNLATMWNRLGRLDEAAALEEKRRELVRRIQGPRHPEMMNSLIVLADIYRQMGRLDDSERAFDEALSIQAELMPTSHPQRATTLCDLARLYITQGRLYEAEALVNEAWCIYERVLGPDHARTCTAMGDLGRVLVLDGRHDEAEPLLLSAYAGLKTHRGPGDVRTRQVAVYLDMLYEGLGRLDESAAWGELSKEIEP